jgi:8-oxo-dGTP pyrophosphatase MutT (NUDIX family)
MGQESCRSCGERATVKPRRTARVLVFDPAGRVLLIWFVVMRAEGEFCFWLTPGGEIEAGESELAAAARELREELGLKVPVRGPVYSEATQFEHQGEMRDNVDYFFTATCPTEAPVLRGVTVEEIAVMREIRWWTAEEIEASGERFFPADIVARVREFGGQSNRRSFDSAALRSG